VKRLESIVEMKRDPQRKIYRTFKSPYFYPNLQSCPVYYS
jgi:hypothetical protein